MSPLILVVLTIAALSPSLADVSHVLAGTAHPPKCKCQEQEHHHHEYDSSSHYHGEVPLPPGAAPTPAGGANNVVPGSVAFWWADSNSPFKHAYEYFKKCSVKGNCFPPVAPGFQVPNNLPQNNLFPQHNNFPQNNCGPSGCSVSGSIDVHKLHAGGNAFGPVDIQKNPFLNGQITDVAGAQGVTASVGGSHSTVGGGGHLDLSKNPFLNHGGQTAFSGTGQTVVTGSDGFLGVQPSVPFGKNTNKPQPFPTAYPNGGLGVSGQGLSNQQGSQPFPTGHPSQQFGGQPFPTNHPISQDGKFENCKQPGYVCVAAELCFNGVVKSHGFLPQRTAVQYCEIGKEVCCRQPQGAVTQQPGGSSSSYSSFINTHTAASSSSSSSTSGSFGGIPSRSAVANPSDITVGKSSIPGSTIKLSGSPGFSPGTIQVLGGNEPNPYVSSAGESGSGVIHTGSVVTNKVVRNTTPNPNSVFGSTIDYSNDKLDQLSFVSTTQGPQYLPPVSTPVPSSHIPDLELPSISTYQPSIPTTSRPFVTRPIIPGSSVVSVVTDRPFIPSSPKPFVPLFPDQQQHVPSYTPKPTASNEYLPPRPSTPTPFVTQPSQPPVSYTSFPPRPSITPVSYPTRPPVTYTQPPYTRPTFQSSYIPPSPTPSKPYVPPYNPPTPSKPYVPPYKPQPTVIQPHVTNGYSYPTPTPSFEYPKPTPPPLRPEPSITNNNYIPPKTPPQPTPGYQYPTPTPAFEYTKQPTSPRPSLIPSGSININNGYIPPKVTYPTPKPYNPQPQPSSTPGYRYPTPTPAFVYPSPSPSQPPRVVTQPPYKPPTNEYLPVTRPEPNFAGSNTDGYRVPRPTTKAPTYIPPLIGQPDDPNVVVVRYPTEPPQVFVGCPAALRCVQENYCTADGFISNAPVVLTRDQEYLRVPTTDCHDKETGIQGKCCRDPNYVDPWPSANLINGVDNGQYREDPNLGQYFPQKQRPARSETSGNVLNLVSGNGRKVSQQYQQQGAPQQFLQQGQQYDSQFVAASNNDDTCGVRRSNAQPRGAGPLDVAFGEIPWQAMVLRDTNRSLLCGGVIVKSNAVLTDAKCVEGLATSDILIKGGEWKLGIDEEPLPFQIVKVAAIVHHPSLNVVLLMLQERLRLANNIAPICLGAPNQAPSGQCISTGWGKQILQVHLRGAIMRSIEVSLLDSNQCSETLANRYQDALQNYSPNTICGYSNSDQCDVDYGSALACTNGNGQYTLAGIFSWDTGCKDQSQIGGYIPPDVEWIESTCSKPLTHLKALDRQYRNQ